VNGGVGGGPGDDPADVATQGRSLPEQRDQLIEDAASSYQDDVAAQVGITGETTEKIWKYVDFLAADGREEALLRLDRAFAISLILDTLHIGTLYRPDVSAIIDEKLSGLPSGKTVASLDTAQPNVHEEADPVELFSGQFVQRVTDTVIDGAGIQFTFRRVYKSRAVYYGSLGASWDHAFNLYLRQNRDRIFRSSGELREDTYVRHPRFGQAGFNFWAPPDGQHGIIEENGTSFLWRTPDGTRYFYGQDPGDLTFHRIDRIEDRFGNYLAFSYSDGRLHLIEINNAKRLVTFDYDDQDRIVALRDHTGRRWIYAYDDYGDLVSVTTPATDQHPAGSTTTYEYSSAYYSPPLQHNLVRIFDPERRPYVENEYSDQAELLNFNRVVCQRQGNAEYLFQYEAVIEEFELDYSPTERPVIQVNQVNPNGHQVHLIFNRYGGLILQEEYVSLRGQRRLLRWRFRYNRDGALIGLLTPEGNVTQWLYGREYYARVNNIEDEAVDTDDNLTAAARLAFGNVLAVVRRGRPYDVAQMNLNRGIWGDFFPDLVNAADAADIILKYSYEPDYQQIETRSDPRFTASADPLFVEGADHTRTLVRYEYSTLPQKLLQTIQYPDCTYPAPLPDGTPGVTAIQARYLRYDARGRLQALKDPIGSTTQIDYYPAGSVKEGYVRRITADVGGLNLATSFEVNDLGLLLSTVDPRGTPTTYVVNEMEQTTEIISGGPGYRSRFFFNGNGLLERRERDNLDEFGTPSPDGDEILSYRYDEQNNLIRETRGASAVAKALATRHCYGTSNERLETTYPAGNRVRFFYDERLLRRAVISGPGTAIASTTREERDGDGRTMVFVDGRGHRTEHRYDCFGRTTSILDPLGNLRQLEYDKLGNVVLTRFFERLANRTHTLLERREFNYDEGGSAISATVWLFPAPIPTADIDGAPDAEFLAARALGSVSPVVTLSFYDANGRWFRSVNAKGQEASCGYDAVGRRTVERDQLGHYSRTFYDENSNVKRVDRHELVMNVNGTVVREDVFSLLHEYDLLDRRIATRDGLGNRTTFGYDSRDHLTSIVDALGNTRRFRYDAFGRQDRIIQEITDTGLGTGVRLPDEVVETTHDDNDRPRTVKDPMGSVTVFDYDELDRLWKTTYADGSFRIVIYDADDNVVREQDPNGLAMIYQIDALSRRKRLDLDTSGLNALFPYPAGAELFEAFDFDGLGRCVRMENDHCITTRVIDSLGRPVEETVQFTPAPGAPNAALTLARGYDLLSNRTNIHYPSGRQLKYDHDGINRVFRITNLANGNPYPGSNGAPQQYEIARYRYRGLRLRQATYGNGAGYRIAHDGAARAISVRHTAAGARELELQQLFDGAGNRRLQLTTPPVAPRPNTESYSFDSAYRLTNVALQARARINSSPLRPPAAPIPEVAMVGQQTIDNAIGSLANPASYTYRYDRAGNRLEERPNNGPPITYTPNGLNEIASVNGTPLGYDANGNLLGDGRLLYRYNYRNQLVSAALQSSGVEVLRLSYDATGRLVRIDENGQVTHCVHDGLNVIEEYKGGTLAVEYVYEDGVDRRCQMAAAGNEQWYHRDLAESTRWLSDAGGQFVAAARIDYEPFGATTGAPNHDYLFAGLRFFPQAGLYHARARQYSPSLGRFIQRDPKGFVDGPNLYVYCGNNPVTFSDPFGTQKAGVQTPNQTGQSGEQVFSEILTTLGKQYNEQVPFNDRKSIVDFTLEQAKKLLHTVDTKTRELTNWTTKSGQLQVSRIRAFETGQLQETLKHMGDTGKSETMLYIFKNGTPEQMARYEEIVRDVHVNYHMYPVPEHWNTALGKPGLGAISYAKAENMADRFFRGVTLRRGGVPMRLPKTPPGGPKLPGPMALVNVFAQVTEATPGEEGTMNPMDINEFWLEGPRNAERFNASQARRREIERAEREKELARFQAASDWVRRISRQGAEGGPGSDRE
jgi:RHS repeat-associated protein